jgi:chromosome segregation ATPase
MASVMRLHLKYRLWIAEMNSDINVRRIFNDYVLWLKTHNHSKDVEERIKLHEKNFSELRKELDELRHEMHITKMKLAALSKDESLDMEAVRQDINHVANRERYEAFREKFTAMKKEFKKLEPAV